MKNSQRTGRALVLSLMLITMLSCALFAPQSGNISPVVTATTTPAAALPGGNITGSSGAGGNSGGGGSGAGPGGGNSGGTGGNSSSAESTATDDSPPSGGPYIVKQIMTLGHANISGQACSITQAFSITVTAPNVSFAINFVPASTVKGSWTYAYSIPKAGESHAASGSYTLSGADTDGTLHLSMTGSDHVVFKGFDGKKPTSYKFDLQPSTKTTCPPG